VVSAGISFLVILVPGLKLRASEEAELLGMDDDQLGEFAYDYVEVRRDYLACTLEHREREEKRFHEVPSQSQLGAPGSLSLFGIGSGLSRSAILDGRWVDFDMRNGGKQLRSRAGQSPALLSEGKPQESKKK
jgi:hypothetical protein